MITPVYGVGDPIRSRCTKCKVMTRHLVVALVAGKPARVQCTRCEGIHNYRPETTETPARAAATRGSTPRTPKARKRGASAVEAEWQRLLAEKSDQVPVHYRMELQVSGGDVLDHPTFGLGVVRKVIPPHTAEVLFREGIKRLRCGGNATPEA